MSQGGTTLPSIMPESKNDEENFDLDAPGEMSVDEFNDVIKEVAQLSEAEAQEEWLESCRYGEVDILRALLKRFPTLPTYINPNTLNSGLHMASANGHLLAVKFLIHYKHGFTKNSAGNTPLHWAAANGQADVVSFFTKHAEMNNIDVLEKNEFGRSALTEGFTSQKEGVVEALLEHDSAAEEKLLSVDGGSKVHVHKLFNKDKPLLIRELAMVNADNPFADSERPDQDTTGLSIWSASLVLARWMSTKSWENAAVLELGAGCGVPGLAVGVSETAPKQVYITDLNPQTVENIDHNIELNNVTKTVKGMRMDWCDKSTWPTEKLDYVIGSDLIYQKSLVPLLTKVVLELLKPGGTFFYVAPDTGRDGLDEFIQVMKKKCPDWKQQTAPAEYHANPLTNGDDEECFLHFQELSSLTFILYEFPIQ